MNTAVSSCQRIRVSGTVQGVGFRPFVFRLATAHGLSGWVANRLGEVEIQVEGPPEAITRFTTELEQSPPPQAQIRNLSRIVAVSTGATGFEIRESCTARVQSWSALPEVLPDLAVCDACLEEMFDPADRRYRYPLINCVNCGPRYTIIGTLPYDRSRTSMAAFAMCAACRREYHDPRDRRFHAQPVACPHCGPEVSFVDAGANQIDGDPVRQAAQRLREGAVVAVKGVGGYHLAVDATNEQAVRRLRLRKHRAHKPLALMAGSLRVGKAICELGMFEQRLLISPARPIVLLKTREHQSRIAPSVAPGQRCLGIMLPYTPLHHLLLAELQALGDAEPLIVLTSANISDEPIISDDRVVRDRLRDVADFFLMHDRPIHARCDDSVTRIAGGRPMMMRCARGYAPRSIELAFDFPEPVLACGGQLKNTFCLAQGRQAVLSPHLGDLASHETANHFADNVKHLQQLLGTEPAVIAHDLHSGYTATQYALDQSDVRLMGVQHHHAHVAAVLAEHGLTGPVIGVALDGSGLGTDQRVWGGEFLIADLGHFNRAAHLEYTPLPGGERAIREPWRLTVAWLDRLYGRDFLQLDLPLARALDRRACRVLQQMIHRHLNCPQTSSMGRLFDAVAALVLNRRTVSYEGQAAMELEALVKPDVDTPPYSFAVQGQDPAVICCDQLIRGVVDDLCARVAPRVIAGRFHRTVAAIVVHVCRLLRRRFDLNQVVLAGGVFQNAVLLNQVTAQLRDEGFEIYTNTLVPLNDGGLSLGQAAIAAARLERR